MRNGAFLLSLVFIVIIPWEGVLQIPGLGTGTLVLGVALAISWLVSVIFTNRFRKPHLFHLAILLFVLWNAISIFWSADPQRTVNQILTWMLLLGLIFTLWDLYNTRTAILAGLQAYILGAFIAIGSAIFNFLANNPFYTNYERFSPGVTNPDGFAFIIVLGIPVAWYLAASMNTTKIGVLLKLINYAYIPAAFMGLALSGTRTALIATIPGMVFGFLSLTHLRIWARFAIVLFLLSAILMLLPVVQPLRSDQRLGTTLDAIAEGDLNQRTFLWSEGFETFVEHPLRGVGSNMYRSVNRLGKVAHNTFLSVLVELGLIGLGLFGIILMIAVFQVLNQPNRDKTFWFSILMVWAIGASTLTWEYRKTTWLFLTFIVASGASTRYSENKHIEHAQSNDIRASKDTKPVVLSNANDSVTVTSMDDQAIEKLDRVGTFCPYEECPDNGNVQTEEQKNIIRYGKNKTGRQRFKCKTCGRTFT